MHALRSYAMPRRAPSLIKLVSTVVLPLLAVDATRLEQDILCLVRSIRFGLERYESHFVHSEGDRRCIHRSYPCRVHQEEACPIWPAKRMQ